jgi:ATP-dependent Clp protease ATP-binding subunit ClpB
MSEFMEAHSVSKLIGAPPGFIGHEERGQLTESVRSQPYSVILLDEVEKAHPKILDLFLQVFDGGSLTDAHGTKCDFRETIIIMTSNLGAGGVIRPIGFSGEIQQLHAEDELERSVETAVKHFFRPEFLNRLTKLVVFHPLDGENMREILHLILCRLNDRLQSRQVTLELGNEAAEFLIKEGCNAVSGARGLEKIFEENISMILSRHLIKDRSNEMKVFRIDFDPESRDFVVRRQ